MMGNNLITISSPSIRLVGNRVLAEKFIGPAKSQMKILLNQMKFQNLNQGIRRVQLNQNVSVECINVFNLQIININAEIKTVKDIVQEFLYSDLWVVYGNHIVLLSVYNVSVPFVAGSSISTSSGGSGEILYVEELSHTGGQTIYGTFTGYNAGDLVSSNASSGTLTSASGKFSYKKDYKYRHITDNKIVNDVHVDTGVIFYPDAFDKYYSPDPEDYIKKEWSKTVNLFTVCAIVYEPKNLDDTPRNLSEFIYNNIKYQFYFSCRGEEIQSIGGEYHRYLFIPYPNPAFYERDILHTYHIGFDVWQDEEETYCVSIMDEANERLTVYKLNMETLELEIDNTYESTIRDDYYTYYDGIYPIQGSVDEIRYTDEEKELYVHLLGYGYRQETDEHVAYWGELSRPLEDLSIGSYYEQRSADYFYCYSVLNTSESEKIFLPVKHDIIQPPNIIGAGDQEPSLVSALWNPMTRTIRVAYLDKSFLYSQEIFEGPCENASWLDCYYSKTTYTLGDFVVGDEKFPLGEYSNSVTTVDSALTDAVGTPGDSKRYKLGKWIFTSQDESVFSYQTNDMVTASPCNPSGREDGSKPLSEMTVCVYACEVNNGNCYDENGDLCGSIDYNWYDYNVIDFECLEYIWKEQTHGDIDWLKYASDRFPHDEGWTAILLKGMDKKVEYKNWVIYKDLETEGDYLVVTDNGQKYKLSGIDRAFFFQFDKKQNI